ncbi:MAG: hypothetical protein F6K00_35170 [Leptolyngbya sp. SIOISBB]|nr:hypothetical protein [Leptolyngbya sp. SIOISBB]
MLESAELVSTQCETTRYPFKDEEFSNCVLNYQLVMNDGNTVRETHEWYWENGAYHLVGLYWPEAQTEN